MLQWLIKECVKAGSSQMDPSRIAQRLLILNMVSIYTTSYVFTNCVLDLYGTESRDDFVTGLREECDRVSHEYNGLSAKEAIDKLYRIDSSVRESMRVSCFGIVSLPRTVASCEGLELGKDIRIPAGVRMGVPSQAIHLDDHYYDDPLIFDAFRFSRPHEGTKGAGRQGPKQELSVSISESFLTYGYGKHACPGRWFASQMMKIALAHVISNYEVECVGEKPEKKALLNMILPPTNAQIRVRRRA